MRRRTVTHLGTEHHPGSVMSTVAFVDRARNVADQLVKAEGARGYKVPEARARVAHRIGCLPGTLWNLARNRLKKVPEGFIATLHADNVRRLQQDLTRAQHEHQLAIQIGLSPDSPEMAALATEAKALVALIEEAGR